MNGKRVAGETGPEEASPPDNVIDFHGAPFVAPAGALTGLALRVARLAKDAHRPRYHFQPRAGEFFQDTIPFFWKGVYHVFFQYAPDEWAGDKCVWGHVRSTDLVHWEELPVAITNGPEQYDRALCASGCVLSHAGKVHIFYGGVDGETREETHCLATALDDDLIHWQKDAANPIMRRGDLLPSDIYHLHGRWSDPDIWKEGDTWYMLLAASLADQKTAAIPLYASADLRNWSYVSCFYQAGAAPMRAMEYPHFFALDGRHVLFHHPWGMFTTFVEVGEHKDGHFVSQRRTHYDSARACATKTLLDDQGRRIGWSWVLEDRPAGADSQPLDSPTRRAGWSGLMSLPRQLHVAPDGALLMEPPAELEALRGRHRVLPAFSLGPEDGAAAPGPVNSQLLLDGVRGDCLEIIARFRPQSAREFGLLVRCAPDLTEAARIGIDLESGKLSFDNTHSSLDSEVFRTVRRVDLPPAEDGLVTVRVFVDRSVVEVFANRNRACITGRAYPKRPDSLHVGVYCSGGSVRCEGIDIWQMNSIYREAPSAETESKQNDAAADGYEFRTITDEEREMLGWPKS
jgi:beta-fructofuranosidase